MVKQNRDFRKYKGKGGELLRKLSTTGKTT